jgi:DNA polymerase III subunit epsilon
MSAVLDQVRSWWGGRGTASNHGAALERWVVIDVETSGLDASSDHLLAIAALGLQVDWTRQRLDIVLGDSFEVVLQQQTSRTDRDNILLHGIGEQQQRDGMVPGQALQAFADFVQSAPLLAFHSAFDATMLDRHCKQHLGRRLSNEWVDIADLCSVTHEGVRARSLDEWMAHFGIRCLARHQASADTLAESELLLQIWPRMAPQCSRWHDVVTLAGHRRWLGA